MTGTSSEVRRIIVGVDGSEESRNATAWAANLGRQLGAEVIVVHALPLSAELVRDVPPVGLSRWRTQLRHNLYGSWCEPLRQCGVKYRVVLVEKSAGVALLGVAAKDDADMIVLGGRQGGSFAGRLTGSLSYHLTHHASCPVVIVPLKKVSAADSGGKVAGPARSTAG